MQALRQAAYTNRPTDLAELTHRLTLAKGSATSLQGKRANRLIYMVEDDPIQAAELAEQIGYFGYSVKSFPNPAELEDAIQQAPPRALLTDVSFPEGKMWGYEAITKLRAKFPELPPILFITINDQMPFRLQAVRVGGEACFTKPVERRERRLPAAFFGARYRDRHRPRSDGTAFPLFQPAGCFDYAQVRRHWPGIRDQQRIGGTDAGQYVGGEREHPWKRLHFPFHHPRPTIDQRHAGFLAR
jgi:CheY-like chemotaxis protein